MDGFSEAQQSLVVIGRGEERRSDSSPESLLLSWGLALRRDSVPIHPTLVTLACSRSAPFCTELTQAACQRRCHEMALMLIGYPDSSDERGINANSNVSAIPFRRFPVGNLRQTLSALVSAFLETTESLVL